MCVKKSHRSGALGRIEVVDLAQKAGRKAGNAEDSPIGSFRWRLLCFVILISGTKEIFN